MNEEEYQKQSKLNLELEKIIKSYTNKKETK